jgi:hypothetical protein
MVLALVGDGVTVLLGGAIVLALVGDGATALFVGATVFALVGGRVTALLGGATVFTLVSDALAVTATIGLEPAGVPAVCAVAVAADGVEKVAGLDVELARGPAWSKTVWKLGDF